MKTTELFVEQVLIGFMVLLIAGLPLLTLERLGPLIATDDVFKGIAAGAAVIGGAYLLGVVFDRYADARMQGFERHIRARFAAELRGQAEQTKRDPFPEGRYRIHLLYAGGESAEWFGYLRSTMRLSRALTVFVPGLTLSAVLAVSGGDGSPSVPDVRGILILVASYFVLPMLGACLGRTKLARLFKAPRTDDEERLASFAEFRGCPGAGASGGGRRGALVTLLDIAFASMTWTAVSLIVAAFVVASGREPVAVGIAVTGAGLAVLAAWAWWRIVRTFMTYLRLFYEFPPARPE